ncbi:MAG: 1-phosphofructokinase [Thermoanaerobacteraceae bacterium]|nr:1-phosphofructokinase [Thermoanaerobacteraceae bacterium]
MIVTVTPNPAIDRTIIINKLEPGQLNRVERTIIDLGGKGINVAKNIKVLGGNALCLGFIGKKDYSALEYLNSLELKHDFTFIEGRIRVNIKLIDIHASCNTDINEYGPMITSQEERNLINKIKLILKNTKVLVLSGSLPPGLNNDFYKKLILHAKKSGAKVILDADNEALKLGIEAQPYMIKPNIHEFSQITSNKIDTTQEIIEASLRIIKKGVSVVAVSMGNQGSITVTPKKAYIVPPLDVKVKSTVGAGDAMVAGFAMGLAQNHDFTETLRVACAASSAAVTQEGTKPIELHTFNELLKQIKVKEICLTKETISI